MLSRPLRITQRYDYNRVKKYGKAISYHLFVLSWLKVSENTSRFGIILTNKIESSAVKRHSAKRLLYELIQKNIAKFKSGYLFVFIPKPAIIGKSYEEVNTLFDKVLSEMVLP